MEVRQGHLPTPRATTNHKEHVTRGSNRGVTTFGVSDLRLLSRARLERGRRWGAERSAAPTGLSVGLLAAVCSRCTQAPGGTIIRGWGPGVPQGREARVQPPARCGAASPRPANPRRPLSTRPRGQTAAGSRRGVPAPAGPRAAPGPPAGWGRSSGLAPRAGPGRGSAARGKGPTHPAARRLRRRPGRGPSRRASAAALE